jgi:hypothetical protein
VNSLLQERDAEFKPKIEAIKGGLTGLSLDINFNVSGKKAKGLQCIQAWWGSGSTLGQGVGKTGYPGEVESVTKARGMQLTKGMALYSPDRDLYLGGAPRANSMYAVHG